MPRVLLFLPVLFVLAGCERNANTSAIPPGLALLDTAAKFYAAHKTFEADLTSKVILTESGSSRQFDTTLHLAIQRPNLVAVTLQTGKLGGTFVSDGQTLVVAVPRIRRYTSGPAPTQLANILDPKKIILALGGPPLGVETFFQADPVATFEQGLTKSEDLGLEPIGGQSARHVRLTSDAFVTDLWIADGDTPLLLQAQVTPDMSAALSRLTPEQRAQLPPGFGGLKETRTTTYTNWKIDQPLPSTAFSFTPTADYSRINLPGAGNSQ